MQVPVSQPFKFPCNKKQTNKKKHMKTWNVVVKALQIKRKEDRGRKKKEKRERSVVGIESLGGLQRPSSHPLPLDSSLSASSFSGFSAQVKPFQPEPVHRLGLLTSIYCAKNSKTTNQGLIISKVITKNDNKSVFSQHHGMF